MTNELWMVLWGGLVFLSVFLFGFWVGKKSSKYNFHVYHCTAPRIIVDNYQEKHHNV